MQQSDEQSLCATRVPFVQSQCASRVSFDSDEAKETVGTSPIDEKARTPSDDYSEDHPRTILLGSEPKKVGLWSRTMSKFARVMSMDALFSKNLRGSRSLQLEFQQKCEEFDVKPTLFSYNELRLATRDFCKNTKLGQGCCGEVYKGVLPNGSVVAVKRFFRVITSDIDYLLNELFLLTGMKHRNLLTLKGCCLHDSKRMLLVYEYMENFDVCRNLLVKGPHRQMLA